MANAYTTGKRDRMDSAQKAKIRAAFAAEKLEAHLNGETELTQSQVSAAKILMDKGMPSLQSVESTEVNEFDSMSEEELKGMVQALITSHPWLLREFAPGVRAADEPSSAALASPDSTQPIESTGTSD